MSENLRDKVLGQLIDVVMANYDSSEMKDDEFIIEMISIFSIMLMRLLALLPLNEDQLDGFLQEISNGYEKKRAEYIYGPDEKNIVCHVNGAIFSPKSIN